MQVSIQSRLPPFCKAAHASKQATTTHVMFSLLLVSVSALSVLSENAASPDMDAQ
jgi:hypothetical protein